MFSVVTRSADASAPSSRGSPSAVPVPWSETVATEEGRAPPPPWQPLRPLPPTEASAVRMTAACAGPEGAARAALAPS